MLGRARVPGAGGGDREARPALGGAMLERARIRVAVVDDRELVRAGMVSLLGDFADLRVVAELDALDLAHWEGRADVVVVDASIAGGLAPAAARIRERGMAVLALGEGGAPGGQGAALAGAAGLLVPTACRFTLAAAIRDAWRHPTRAFQVWCDDRPRAETTADARLSHCERQVLALYATGAKAQAVATSVGLSANTVTTYVRRIRRKYEQAGRRASSRIDLYRRAVEDGILPPGGEAAVASRG